VSAHRRPAIPHSDAPRGTCRWCGEHIFYAKGPKQGELDRRRRWHPDCVEVYNASDPREARRVVRKRDRGVCADCGIDTYVVRREVRGKGRTRKLRERGYVPRRSLWELDHIVPLIDGGSHALENLQTLCTPCHKQKTAREARERAARSAMDAASEGGDEVAPVPDESKNDTPSPELAIPDRPTAPRGAGDLDSLLDHASSLNERIHALLEDFRASR